MSCLAAASITIAVWNREKEQPHAFQCNRCMFLVGKKPAGLLWLEMAAKNAVYARIEAKFELMHIYYSTKERCIRLPHSPAQELANAHPNNVQFLHYLDLCTRTTTRSNTGLSRHARLPGSGAIPTRSGKS